MTYAFHVGEPAPAPFPRPPALAAGRAWAEVGPGGVQLLVKLDDPGEPERQAFEDGPVSLGLRDTGDESVLLVRAGDPGRPGYVEAEVEVDPRTGWWGSDFELALCDRNGIVRAVRRFEGPEAGRTDPEAVAGPGPATLLPGVPPGVPPYVAVFPEDRYGLMQPRGTVTVGTLVEAGLSLVGLPGWEPGFTEVWDFRFASEFFFSPLQLGRLRALELRTEEQLAGSKTVVVTMDRQLLDWSARNYARLVRVLLGRRVVPYGKAEDAARDLGIAAVPTLAAAPRRA